MPTEGRSIRAISKPRRCRAAWLRLPRRVDVDAGRRESAGVADRDLYTDVERLKLALTAFATGGTADDAEFRAFRSKVLNCPWARLAPSFLKTCRNLSEFWQYIKAKFGTYAERREYLRTEFDALLSALELRGSPGDPGTTATIAAVNSDYVREMWMKALERRATDPEGAITASRTLLESVCKHVLDELEIVYAADADLPALYSAVAKALVLGPSQHTEKVFKQILGGCHSIVEGLGSLRNRIGDAHGQGKKPVRPAPRHAELAVNLAGTMATFLLTTHEDRKAAVPQS